MRNLNEYVAGCMEMLDNIGIKYGNIVEVVPNSRAKKRWGRCTAVPGGYSISINVVLLDERNGEYGLINTILHELLHSCDGCMNHGENWKRLANKVYQEYGIDIKRTSSAADKGVLEEMRAQSGTVKYVIQCKDCGGYIRRSRASKLTKHPDWFRCGKCHGELSLIKTEDYYSAIAEKVCV